MASRGLLLRRRLRRRLLLLLLLLLLWRRRRRPGAAFKAEAKRESLAHYHSEAGELLPQCRWRRGGGAGLPH